MKPSLIVLHAGLRIRLVLAIIGASMASLLFSLKLDAQARMALLVSVLVPSALAVMLFPESAFAMIGSGMSVGQISNNIVSSVQGAGNAVTAICWLSAIVLGAVSVFKFKAHSDNPNQTPLKIPMIYLGCAAGLGALPEIIGTGIATLFGSGAQTVSQSGGGF